MLFLQFAQMSLTRFIQVYIVQGIYGLFYIYMALMILKKDRKKLNRLLSGFYLSAGIAVIINIIYVSITVELIVRAFHFTVYFLFCFAFCFILLFILTLSKLAEIITVSRQSIIMIIYCILLLFLLIIPNGFEISAGTNWVPVWNPFFYYMLQSFVFAS